MTEILLLPKDQKHAFLRAWLIINLSSGWSRSQVHVWQMYRDMGVCMKGENADTPQTFTFASRRTQLQ